MHVHRALGFSHLHKQMHSCAVKWEVWTDCVTLEALRLTPVLNTSATQKQTTEEALVFTPNKEMTETDPITLRTRAFFHCQAFIRWCQCDRYCKD